MDIALATLATTVVSSLLVPFIKAGATRAIESVSDKALEGTEASVEILGKLWQKLKMAFDSTDDQAVLNQFEQRPDIAKGLVEAILKEKLEKDSALASEFQALVREATHVSTGAQVHNAHDVGIVDVRNSDFAHSSGTRITGLQIGGSAVDKDDQ